MCEPVSIALAGTALIGGVMKGVADQQAAEANADATRRNAAVAERAADDAIRRGEFDAGRVQMEGVALEGKQRAAAGAGGVVVDQGSAGDIVEGTAAITAIDVESVRNNAQREAWGLRQNASNMRASADSMDRAGKNALLTSIIGGLTGGGVALLGGYRPSPSAPGAPTPPGR
jgi:hypothetical protein